MAICDFLDKSQYFIYLITSLCTELPLFCTVWTENCISINQSDLGIFFVRITKSKSPLYLLI